MTAKRRKLNTAWRRVVRRAAGLAAAHLPDPAARHIEAADQWLWGEPEIRLLPIIAAADETAVDIGAAMGSYTYFLCRWSAACWAFEPNPVQARRLRRRYPLVRVEACAISDRTGETILSVPIVRGAAYSGFATIEAGNTLAHVPAERIERTAVPMRRLDDFPIGRVGLIKIDVEGHEGAVLTGAADLIASNAPALLIECEDRHRPGAVADLFRRMGAHGYAGYFLLDRRLRPIGEFTPDLQDPIRLGATAAGRYVNNFVFAKRSETLDRLRALSR